MNIKRNIILTTAIAIVLSLGVTNGSLKAQEAKDTTKKEFKPGGKVWGYAFGDWAVKQHADSLGASTAGRKLAAQTQYTGMQNNYNSFNLRRVYLGYDYDISPKFSATLVLAHESGVENNADTAKTAAGATNTSLTSDANRSVYLKYANVRWKNILPRQDIVIGQQATPTYATLSEKIWGYRSIEKTITDMRSTLTGSSSTDLGIGMFGKFDKNENFGYEVMVGNGNGAKFENNRFKKIYTSLYAYFLNKKIVVQLNYDYDRTQLDPYHTSKTMMKVFAAYVSDPISVGVEAYMQTLQNLNRYTEPSPSTIKDTANASSLGISAFVRGRIIKEKLGFFARYDMFNPDTKFNNQNTYQGGGNSVKENFITAGLDYTPIKNVHIMPNIWYQDYTEQKLANIASNTAYTGAKKHDYDLVARVTFYYVFK